MDEDEQVRAAQRVVQALLSYVYRHPSPQDTEAQMSRAHMLRELHRIQGHLSQAIALHERVTTNG